MINITTKSGFKCELEEDVFDDAEFLDFLSSDEAKTAIGKIAECILGKDGKAALYEHCRNEKGKVRASAVEAELVEIMSEAAKANETAKK